MDRRDFVKATLALAGASSLPNVAGAAPSGAPGGASSAPILAAPSFNARPRRDFPGGWIKETTVGDTPAIEDMAASYVTMNPGAMRGLHWHATAAEFGYVVAGACVLSVYDPFGNSGLQELRAGDVWYVPRGYGHSVWAFSAEGCVFTSVYDDGSTSELNAREVADLVRTERPEIVETVLGVTAADLQPARERAPILRAGAVGNSAVALTPRGQAGPAPKSFGFSLMALPPMRCPGGWFVQASKENFPMSLTLIGAITVLEPGGIREPHWHPNADEWDLVLTGRARVTLFAGGDDATAVELGPGDIGFLPRNGAHAVQAIGDEEFRLLSVFNASEFEAIGISEILAGQSAEALARNFGLAPEVVGRLPKGERFIVQGP